MFSKLLGHGLNARSAAEIDGDSPASAKRRRIQLQPLGRAARREPSVGNGDVGLLASVDDILPRETVRRSGGEDAPAPATAPDVSDTAVGGAIGEGCVRQEGGIAVIGGAFRQ